MCSVSGVGVNRIYTAETATRNITDEELFWLFLILFLLRGNTMSSIFRYVYKLLTLDYYFLIDKNFMFGCTFLWQISILWPDAEDLVLTESIHQADQVSLIIKSTIPNQYMNCTPNYFDFLPCSPRLRQRAHGRWNRPSAKDVHSSMATDRDITHCLHASKIITWQYI